MTQVAEPMGLGHGDHLELSQPLGVGREDMEGVFQIVHGQGIHPGGGVALEVLQAQMPALGFQEGRQGLGHRPLVEARLPLSRDAFQGGGA